MKKLIVLLIMCMGYRLSHAQILIQATGPIDVCYPSTVGLEVMFPQPGYDYNWFLGGYGCPNVQQSFPTYTGVSIQAMITGQWYCMGIPQGGGSPQISNPITVRVLPGRPGSFFMPAPGFYGVDTSCVTSAALCISEIYYQGWANTTIKWYKNNVLISGATSGNYTVTTEGYYKYTVANSCVISYSDSTLVTTAPSATITAGGSTTICSGSIVQLNANTIINGAYQWKNNGNNISGATGQSYNASSAGSYTVVITNACGTATSSAVAVTVNPLPSATITPAGPTTFCSGGSVVLNAPVAPNRSYQWKKAANLISGATLSSYTATAGGKYKVIVTNTVTGCSKTTSSATVVTANALPSATITPQGPTTFCAGGSVVLAANTGTGLTYKWKKGASYIPGATLENYTATTGGNYKVEVTNANGCSKTSANVTVTVPCREGEIISENNFNVNIFPNPNHGEFTIRFSNKPSAPVQIQLTDAIGNVVKKLETMDESLIVKESNLAEGIYFLSLKNKNGVLLKKISIAK